MSDRTLLLFDIDGTIMTSGGCGEKAMRLAVKDHFGADDDLSSIEIAGRTDTHISRRLHEKYGKDLETPDVFLDHYLKHLSVLLPQIQGRLLPGVQSLLELLKPRADVVLALLTGNLARGAELKLRHYGVWDYFEFGAYADDHYDRNQLGPFALQRARQRHQQEFDPQRVYVIGDTPHDVACARAIGAKAVAVATGGFTRDALVPCQADSLLQDLSDSAIVLRALGLQ